MAIPFNPAPQGYEHTGRAYRFLLYPNGTGTPTVQGAGVASVARSDTGQFLVTLINAHYKCTKAQPALNLAAGTDAKVQGSTMGNLASGSSVTYYLNVSKASDNTALDVAANANNFISVELVFDDSKVVLG